MQYPAPHEDLPAPPRWSTPQILKSSRAGLLTLVALELSAAIVAAGVHRYAMQTVGKDTAPSIIAAEHIKAALADMDATAANELLEARSVADYDARREEAARALILAAGNITFGDAERGPIEVLQTGLGMYERLIQRARDLHERNDPAFLISWREGAKLADERLLPAADALDQANDRVLEIEYVHQSNRSRLTRYLFALAGLALIGGLIAAQVFLSRRMKRTLNPYLLAATLIAGGSLAVSESSMNREQNELRRAKQDAFASLRALWRARADAYWANGDESRYLLDPANAEAYNRSFSQKIARLAAPPAGVSLESVLGAERRGVQTAGFTGFLADEFNNITFGGERQSALDALARLADYLAIDTRIRSLETSRDHGAAVRLSVGKAPGQSDWAFDRFDESLGQTIEVNQQAFTAAAGRGFSALRGMEIWSAGAAAAVAVLVFLGFGERIREYQ
jgi:hypothetical protein